MYFERIADLFGERGLTFAVPSFLKFAKPLRYLLMIRLQQCEGILGRTVLRPPPRILVERLFRSWQGPTPFACVNSELVRGTIFVAEAPDSR